MKSFLSTRPAQALLFAAAIAAAPFASAKIVTQDVPYEHDGVKLKGFLVYDDSSKAPQPGAILIHEWWGLTDFTKHRAEALARLGFVAFAIDMYGEGKVTTKASEAESWASAFYGKPLMAERARAGLDELLKTGKVDKNRVAAIGYCFGGSTCLALAYSGAPLNAVVTFHGGVFPPQDPSVLNNTKTHFLILHGGADTLVPVDALHGLVKAFEGAKTDYELVVYAGAKHAFSNPDADARAKENNMDAIGYNEVAARRSWKELETFFAEQFGVSRRPVRPD